MKNDSVPAVKTKNRVNRSICGTVTGNSVSSGYRMRYATPSRSEVGFVPYWRTVWPATMYCTRTFGRLMGTSIRPQHTATVWWAISLASGLFFPHN